MRIKVTEERLNDTNPRTGQQYSWKKGDVDEVPDDYGAYLCSHGWVKDLDGNVPSAVRKPGAAELQVQNMKVGSRGRISG